MSYICVICTLNRPPLLPLAIEHRKLLEAIVSPAAVDMSDLKPGHLLLCVDCQVKMLSIHQFQKTAVQGIRNLKYLLSKVNHALPSFLQSNSLQPNSKIEPEVVKSDIIPIKIEPDTKVPSINDNNSAEIPQDLKPCTGKNFKLEPHPSEPALSAKPVCNPGPAGCEARNELTVQTTSNSTTKATQTDVGETIRGKADNNARVNAARYHARVLRSGVRKRYKMKSQPKSLPCPHCDQKLSHAGTLRAHINRKHTEAEPSKCDECGAICRNPESLRQHKYTHKKEQTIDRLNPDFYCAECAMQFPTRNAYDTHRLALKHTPREQYSFECQVCQKKFPKDRTLRQHIDVQHLGLKKHSCAVCGKVYARGASLNQHTRVAHEERGKGATYVCDPCGKAFKVKRSLAEHLLTHQGLRPYKCKVCPATFSYNAALYNHNNQKHLNKKRKKKKAEQKED